MFRSKKELQQGHFKSLCNNHFRGEFLFCGMGRKSSFPAAEAELSNWEVWRSADDLRPTEHPASILHNQQETWGIWQSVIMEKASPTFLG